MKRKSQPLAVATPAQQLEVMALARRQGLVAHFERPGGPLCIRDGRGNVLRRSPSTESARMWLLNRPLAAQGAAQR